jgi:hypothetical protein
MKTILGLFVAAEFAVALMPSFNEGINAAARSWPANYPVDSSFLALIPSPVEVVFSFLAVVLLGWLLAKGSFST